MREKHPSRPVEEGSTFHIPVLRAEATALLLAGQAAVLVDGTVGGGGHAESICEAMPGAARLICCDADADALAAARRRLARWEERVTFVHANFRNLKSELRHLHVSVIDGLLLDLGVSSYQLDEGPRGFSFRTDEPLDMRLDQGQPVSAREVVNTYDETRLADVIWRYGEERGSRRIAARIVAARPVASTGDLAAAVESAVGGRFLLKTLARVFQALRIEVNDELGSLRQVLADAVDLLAPEGRLVVIAYHSLEDRIVKEFFRAESATSIPSGTKLVPDTPRAPRLRVLTRHPVEPGEQECARNGRARSAKLRAAERCRGGDKPKE